MRRPVLATLLGCLLGAGLLVPVTTTGASAEDEQQPRLHLVTLSSPGKHHGQSPPRRQRAVQDEVLSSVDAPDPMYRWTAALNGFAVRLTEDQAATLRGDRRVRLVEPDTVRPLAAETPSGTATVPSQATRGGAGTVVGVVDSGISPEAAVFADRGGLGREPGAFRGTCQPGEDWTADTCNRKVVGARWFVRGFGTDDVAAQSSLSAHDDMGHGTQVASIVAGNTGVAVDAPVRADTFAGVAPQSRLAVYKACWTAPDPADDGCSSADVVSAIDAATRDRVDVLNLSVGTPPQPVAPFDTVERALLGASEKDVLVVTAAGSTRQAPLAGYDVPWALTVGSGRAAPPRGRLTTNGGPRLSGAMTSPRRLRDVPVVDAAAARAEGATRTAASSCTPGSLDAGRTSGAVVICRRGGAPRVEKSTAVARADGVGMVLVNRRGRGLATDVHAVPTLHVGADEGRQLRRWVRDTTTPRATLGPSGPAGPVTGVRATSPTGNPRGTVVKPDLVDRGTGLLAALGEGVQGRDWGYLAGSSAAAARVSGAAARVRSERDWSAARVRSALVTTAGGLPTGLRTGAGAVRPHAARTPGVTLAPQPGDARAFLEGRLTGPLNTPSILLSGDQRSTTRQVRHHGRRALYYSVHVHGLERHEVRASPAALRLSPGETAEIELQVDGARDRSAVDSGAVVLRGADGNRVRIPLVLTR